jgi:hypothetical protein
MFISHDFIGKLFIMLEILELTQIWDDFKCMFYHALY